MQEREREGGREGGREGERARAFVLRVRARHLHYAMYMYMYIHGLIICMFLCVHAFYGGGHAEKNWLICKTVLFTFVIFL